MKAEKMQPNLKYPGYGQLNTPKTQYIEEKCNILALKQRKNPLF